jgi:hypothetical protein
MVIQFGGVVQSISNKEAVLAITPVAGINMITMHERTHIVGPGSIPTSWDAIRPGMRVSVRGIDGGNNVLRAESLVIQK